MVFKIVLFILTISANVKKSLHCSTATFINAAVLINGVEETINGCISPETLKYNGTIRTISVTQKIIPDLNRGAIRNIMDEFDIILKQNNIEIIREEAFLNVPHLTQMDLSHNQISWISRNAFSNLPSLNVIILTNNLVSMSLRSFNNLPNLTMVDLAENNLEHFDQEWFYRTPRLEWLTLRRNRLRSIPQAAFVNFPNLAIIELDKNKIEYIDKNAFIGLRNLKNIHISGNRLKLFEVNIHSPSKLKFVDISFNNITYLSTRMLDIINPNVYLMLLLGNPWQCGCYEKLRSWDPNNSTFLIECTHQELVCIYPKSKPLECIERSDDDFNNEFWISFNEQTLCPELVN